MRLLVVGQSKDIIGGANRSLLDVISILRDKYHHEIFVISPGEGAFTDELKRMGIDYITVLYYQVSFVRMGDYKDPGRFILAAKRDYDNSKIASTIVEKLENRKFDLVYINDTTNTIGYYIAKKLNIPFVWHFRGYNKNIKRYFFYERNFRECDDGKCIAISHAMKKYMVDVRKMSPKNIVVIHNGVTNSGVKIKQPWEESITEGFHIVQCGHLSEAKGQREAIYALAELKRRGYQDIYLHFAGSPLVAHRKSYEDILVDMVNKYSLNNQVIFEGEVKNMGELRKLMQVELMCSLAEPFGRVTVEGMQAGLVVIGCDTGATPEIITDNVDGLLYHRGNIIDLANKIESVYKDHKLGNRLSREALLMTKEKFTMKKNVEEINDLFADMGER